MGNDKCKGCQSELVLDEKNLCAYCELTHERLEDIKPNVNCGICDVIVEEDSEGLFCDVCDSWFHNNCNKTPLNLDLYALLNEAPNNVKWFCDKCIWETEKWIKGLKNKPNQTSIIGGNSTKTINKMKMNKSNEVKENANEDENVETDLVIEEDNEELHEVADEDILDESNSDNGDHILGIPETIIEEYEDEEWENEDSEEWDPLEEEKEFKRKKKQKLQSSKTIVYEDDNGKLRKKYLRKSDFQCKICSKYFTKNSLLKRHMINIHSHESDFQCNICKRYFGSNSALKSHMASHSSDKPFACEVCSITFKTEDGRQRHMHSHATEKPFECNECDQKFARKFLLKSHVRRKHIKENDTTEKSFECTKCDKKFACKRIRNHHMKSHRTKEERPYACDQCDSRFNSPSALKYHEDGHTGVLSAICDICGKGFRNIYSLKVHRMIHTGEIPFTCEVCGKGFRKRGDLTIHLEVHKGKNVICEICGYGTYTKHKLNQHMTTVHNETIFECDICGKKYKSISALKNHKSGRSVYGFCKGNETQEIKEKPFKCRECDKVFASIKVLKLHMKIHTTEMPFECTKCDKKFVSSSYLNEHMQSHRPKEERPYACDQCDARYNKPSKLRYHKESHTGVLTAANETTFESDIRGQKLKPESHLNKKQKRQNHGSPKIKKSKKEPKINNMNSLNNESIEDDSSIPMQVTSTATERMITAQHHSYQQPTDRMPIMQNHETSIATYRAMQNHGYQPPLLLYANSQNSHEYAAQYHGSLKN